MHLRSGRGCVSALCSFVLMRGPRRCGRVTAGLSIHPWQHIGVDPVFGNYTQSRCRHLRKGYRFWVGSSMGPLAFGLPCEEGRGVGEQHVGRPKGGHSRGLGEQRWWPGHMSWQWGWGEVGPLDCRMPGAWGWPGWVPRQRGGLRSTSPKEAGCWSSA